MCHLSKVTYGQENLHCFCYILFTLSNKILKICTRPSHVIGQSHWGYDRLPTTYDQNGHRPPKTFGDHGPKFYHHHYHGLCGITVKLSKRAFFASIWWKWTNHSTPHIQVKAAHWLPYTSESADARTFSILLAKDWQHYYICHAKTRQTLEILIRQMAVSTRLK